MDIFIVSNEAGLQYVRPDLLATGLREASLAMGGHALTAKLPQKSCSSYTPYQPFLWPFQRLEVHAKEVRPCPSTSGQTSFDKYTKTEDNGTIIGSGAYCRLGDIKLEIAPCGTGPTNTIMRAELVAIYAVLLHPNNTSKKRTIATDSKAAMQAIHKQI